GQYGLTPDSAMFLDKRSRAYMGAAARFLLSPELMSGFSDVAAVVRKGGTVIPENGAVSIENPVWIDFARGMAPLMMLPAQSIAEIAHASEGPKWKVL